MSRERWQELDEEPGQPGENRGQRAGLVGREGSDDLVTMPPVAPIDEERLTILLNGNVKMSRGKAAAQAVHAALYAYGIEHGSVVVLHGKPDELRALPIQIADAGRTEIAPGTLTAATDFAVQSPERTRLAAAERECDQLRAERDRLREVVLAIRDSGVAHPLILEAIGTASGLLDDEGQQR